MSYHNRRFRMKHVTHTSALFTLYLLYIVGEGQARTLSNGCSSGWTAFASSCYSLRTTVDRSWHEAYDACARAGAHLVTIETPEEFDWLVDYVKGSLGSHLDRELIWTSGHRDYKTNQWFWDDGTDMKMSYAAWYPGQPSNDNGVEFYLSLMHMDSIWGLNDTPENYELKSICEKPKNI